MPSSLTVCRHCDSPRARLTLVGLSLQGAAWLDGRMTLNDGQAVQLIGTQLTWRKADTVQKGKNMVNLPVYLNGERRDVLFAVDLRTAGLSQAIVAQMGVCLTAS